MAKPFKRLKNRPVHECQWTDWAKDERRGVYVRKCKVKDCGRTERYGENR